MKAKKLFPDLSMKRLWNRLKGIEDKVDEQDEKTPFSFAIDENGNYGYIKEGADSVTPFKYIKTGTHTGNKGTSYTINIDEPFNFFALYDYGVGGSKYPAVLFHYNTNTICGVQTTAGATDTGSLTVYHNSVTFTLGGYNSSSGSVTSTYIYGLL